MIDMPIKDEDREALKLRLLELRNNLVNDVDNINKRSNDEFDAEVPDVNDEASRTYSRQVMLARGEQDRAILKRIDEALDALERGEYGTCVDCEEDIPLKRLISVPYVERCIECMTKWEQSQTEL